MNNTNYTAAVITGAFTGTSAMTSFSYAASVLHHRDFFEPRLLADLIARLRNQKPSTADTISGWVIHYSVGLLFTSIYNQIWQKTSFKPTLLNGLLLGTISGVFGITGWKIVLLLHPNPPMIVEKRFLPHLLPAHAVFGLFAAAGTKIFN
jgi:hypothetical protein